MTQYQFLSASLLIRNRQPSMSPSMCGKPPNGREKPKQPEGKEERGKQETV